MDAESYGRDFEYDEDVESDEAFEADEADEADEAFEASDEGSDEAFEADEGDGEADEGSDEAFEASDEASREGDGEADEADEAYVSASARLNFEQDRNRRAAFARKLAADQRTEAQRAASTQRSIASQIRSIQPGGPAKVASVGALQGAGVVTAILPNGRRSRMRIIPTLAPVRELNRLRAVVQVNERRQAVATSRNSRAITALASTQAAAVKQLTAQQVKSDKELGKRLVEGHNRLDKRITKELSGGSGVLDRHGKKLMRVVKRHRQRAIWNNVLLATSAPFFAAYGDRGNPFGTNNLILTGSLLGWMFGDEVIDQFAGKSGVAKGGANLWSYLAPVGNGATAYFLLRNKQYERFVTGVTDVAKDATTAKIPLGDKIGSKLLTDFKSKGHSVAVTFATDPGAATTVSGVVSSDGNLVLTFDPKLGAASKVAWIVDTTPEASVAVVA